MRICIIFVLSLAMLSGCANNTTMNELSEDEYTKIVEAQSNDIVRISEELETLKDYIVEYDEQVKVLQKMNEELQRNLEFIIFNETVDKTINEPILKTIFLSNSFAESYIDVDIDEMASQVSDPVSIIGDKIVVMYEGNEYEHNIVEDVVGFSLHSYGLLEDRVFYQYVLYKEGGIDVTGRFFMNLEYRQEGGLWKLVGIEFDI